MAQRPPDRLPADFFNKPAGNAPPERLPANAFDQQPKAEDVFNPPAPEDTQGLRSWLTSMLPDWETAFRAGGAGAGGALGFAGGTVAGTPIAGYGGMAVGSYLGGAAGDSLYQIIQHLIGSEDAAQTSGEAASRISEGGIQGLVQEGTGGLMTAKAPGMLRRGAEKLTGQVLQPANLAAKAELKKDAAELSRMIPMARSSEALLEKLNAGMSRSIKSLNAAYDAVPETQGFSTAKIVDGLKAARNENFMRGKPTPGKTSEIRAFDELIEWFSGHPEYLTASELRKNKKLWDEVVNYGRRPNAQVPEGEAAYKQGADLIRALFEEVKPEITDKSHAVHLWSKAVESLGQAEVKDFGKQGLPWKDLGLGTAVGAVMGGGGGDLATSGGAALAAVAIRQLMGSTAWKTASIQARNQAIKALESGVPIQEAIGVLTGAAVGGGLRMMRGN